MFAQRRKYSYARRSEVGLGKILALIVVAGIVVYGIAWGAYQLNLGWGLEGQAEASPVDRLAEAERLLQAQQWDDARDMLAPLLTAETPQPGTSRALLLASRLDSETGNAAGARGHLERIVRGFSATPEWPQAALRLARVAEAAGEIDRAKTLYTEVAETAPPELRAEARLGLGRLGVESGAPAESRELVASALDESAWQSASWQAALDEIGNLNVKTIFGTEPTDESRVYTVQSGDTLTAIGIKLNTTQGLLMRANGITDPASLRVGQTLKYTPKDFRIVIERSTCQLFLLDRNGIFKRYRVGLGKEGHATALGRYTIGNKQKDPVWHKPGFGPVPAGDPTNELGTRWMPLVPVEDGLPTDLGIHGTIAPETIGSYSSSGCARMLPADVEELFDLVVRSTPVEIVETFTPAMLVNS